MGRLNWCGLLRRMAHGWEWNGVGQLLFSFSGLWAQAAPRQLAHERDELAHEMECLLFPLLFMKWNGMNKANGRGWLVWFVDELWMNENEWTRRNEPTPNQQKISLWVSWWNEERRQINEEWKEMEFFFDCRNLFLHGINLTPPQRAKREAVSSSINSPSLRLSMESPQRMDELLGCLSCVVGLCFGGPLIPPLAS